MKLADALSRYLSTRSSQPDAYGNQELHRFGRWVGWERSVADLAPPEIAQYAEETRAAGGDTYNRLTPLKEFLSFLKRQGELTHSLAPHVKIPRANRATAARERTIAEAVSMTITGHEALRTELGELKGNRVHVAGEIRKAAADKDFSENAPLDAAREHQGKSEARIRELEETLRRAVVIGDGDGSIRNGAQVGNRVVLHDLASGKEARYLLVDSSEADPANGKISVSSPVGRSMVGRYSGDEVEVTVPKGVLRYRIASIEV